MVRIDGTVLETSPPLPGTILEEIRNEAVQSRGRFLDALPRLCDMQDARLTGLLIGHRLKRVVEPAHHHSQRLPFVDAIVVVVRRDIPLSYISAHSVNGRAGRLENHPAAASAGRCVTRLHKLRRR